MTGPEVSGVNLRIEDVLTEEEYDRLKHRPEEPEQLGQRRVVRCKVALFTLI